MDSFTRLLQSTNNPRGVLLLPEQDRTLGVAARELNAVQSLQRELRHIAEEPRTLQRTLLTASQPVWRMHTILAFRLRDFPWNRSYLAKSECRHQRAALKICPLLKHGMDFKRLCSRRLQR